MNRLSFFPTVLFLLMSSIATAQSTNAGEFENAASKKGYIITKPIKTSLSKAANARFDRTIEANTVCIEVESEPGTYFFPLIDASESLEVGKTYITYYEPAQDEVPPRYAKRTVFDRSAKKVVIYSSAPASWQPGVMKTLVPKVKGYLTKVTVKPIVIKDQNAVFINHNYEDNSQAKSSMYGKTVYEITSYTEDGYDTIYGYNGQQIVKFNLNADGDFSDDFCPTLKVDENGYCHAKGDRETDTFHPCSELGCVYGEYPSMEVFGWIDNTLMVIDNELFKVVK